LPDEPRYYINDTGTGNTFNLSHMRVIEMVADSLRYWVAETPTSRDAATLSPEHGFPHDTVRAAGDVRMPF
jgi:hypothetical protein